MRFAGEVVNRVGVYPQGGTDSSRHDQEGIAGRPCRSA